MYKSDNTIALLDMNNLIYRFFFAIKAPMYDKQGQLVNAVYGLTRLLLKIKKENYPYIAACFDHPNNILKKSEKLSTYKGNRQSMPDSLLNQLNIIKYISKMLGISTLEKDGFEADDLIAHLTLNNKRKFKIHIFTNDKDMYQLIDENVNVISTDQSGMEKIFAAEDVFEKIGCYPDRVLDYLAIAGDASDNVPGIPGIGPKGALEIIKNYDDVIDAFANPGKLSTSLSKKLNDESLKLFLLSKDIINLNRDFNITIPNILIKNRKCSEEMRSVLLDLNFKSLLPKLDDITSCSTEYIQPTSDLQENLIIEDFVPEIHNKLLSGNKCIILYNKSFDQFHNFSLHQIDLMFISEPNILFKLKLENISDALINVINQCDLIIIFDLKQFLHSISGIEASSYFSIYRCNKIFDMTLASYLLDPNTRMHSYEYICEKYQLLNTNNEPYVSKIINVFNLFNEKIKNCNLSYVLNNIEIPFSHVLYHMEKNGIFFDRHQLEILKQRLEICIQDTEEQIYKIANEKFNIASQKQLAIVLFEKLKIKKTKRNKTGYKTDIDSLIEILEDEDSKNSIAETILHLIINWRHYKKIISTYIDGIIKYINPATNRVHPIFEQTGTATGRISCKNPNMQNIPRVNDKINIRSAISSNEDKSIVSFDYSQIELRVLASLSKEPTLIEAFKEKKDIHIETASKIFNKKDADISNEERASAKTINFGIIFGQQAFSLSKQLKISKSLAQEFIDEYFKNLPYVKQFIENLYNITMLNGYSITFFGRRRNIPEILDNNMSTKSLGERLAVNSPIQGTAADFMKLAMIDIYRYILDNKIDAKIILQAHDELVLEINNDILHNIKNDLIKILEYDRGLAVPMSVSIDVSKNWN